MKHLLTSLILAALPMAGISAGFDMTDQERAAFRDEVRAALLIDPSPIENALTRRQPSLFATQVADDLALLRAEAALFEPTSRGIGSDTPRITILFFETFPCAACGAAWDDLVKLSNQNPDIRIEPRFAQDGGAAQLLLSLLTHQDVGTYHDARRALYGMATPLSYPDIAGSQGWFQDRMLRPAPQIEAAAFKRLGLDTSPSYVFPDMMVRGAIPLIALEKYIRN